MVPLLQIIKRNCYAVIKYIKVSLQKHLKFAVMTILVAENGIWKLPCPVKFHKQAQISQKLVKVDVESSIEDLDEPQYAEIHYSSLCSTMAIEETI